MGEVWIKEAEQLKPAGNSNAMSGKGGPRATLHCTVSNPGSFDAMHRVLTSKTSEPHLLYDGKTDRLGQYFPLDRSARALARGTLPYSHNKVGTVNIQIEVCNMPVDWTASSDWNPGPNFRAMLRAIRSWGIRDEFVFRPARTAADRANVVRPDRLLTSTEGGDKWWGHCHYGQGESHWDPGPLNLTRFFGAAPTTTPAPVAPQEDDMPTPQELWRWDGIPSPDKAADNPSWQPDSYLRETYLLLRTVRADVGALRAVVAALAPGQPLTADEITAAAKAGASAALDEKIADADVSLNVQPGAQA